MDQLGKRRTLSAPTLHLDPSDASHLDPLVPPAGMPKFAGQQWQLRAVVLSGLDNFWSANPTSAAVLPPVPSVLTPPAGAEALFQAHRTLASEVP